VSVDSGKWSLDGGGGLLLYHLTRTYNFSEQTPDATVRIYFIVKSTDDLTISTGLRIFLKPFALKKEWKLVLGLFTKDYEGAFMEVNALPNVAGGLFGLDAAICVHDDDVPKCVSAISSGKEMAFLILHTLPPKAEPFLKPPLDPLVNLNLPNDPEFKQLYAEVCEKIEQSHNATRARHLREGWYRRR
jgi:hypothetical protein